MLGLGTARFEGGKIVDARGTSHVVPQPGEAQVALGGRRGDLELEAVLGQSRVSARRQTGLCWGVFDGSYACVGSQHADAKWRTCGVLGCLTLGKGCSTQARTCVLAEEDEEECSSNKGSQGGSVQRLERTRSCSVDGSKAASLQEEGSSWEESTQTRASSRRTYRLSSSSNNTGAFASSERSLSHTGSSSDGGTLGLDPLFKRRTRKGLPLLNLSHSRVDPAQVCV
eukprot:1161587-Pelagomonas_calceolata.AAC.3